MSERRKLLAVWTWGLCFLLGIALVHAADPTVTVNRFHNLPARIFFFEDSPTLVYHDIIEGNIHISHDEGKKWQRVTDIPRGDVEMVIAHPFNNRVAYAITKTLTHWRTDDRGKTWRSFEVPVEASRGNPLSFHSDPKLSGYVLYQGVRCDRSGWGSVCRDETYYTKDGFADGLKKLLSETVSCQFAHSKKEFKHDAPSNLIYCVGFDTESQDGKHSLGASRVFSSTDFFEKENRVEDFGIGKGARGVVALAIVSKFAVVALKDLSAGGNGEMMLYVSVDAKTWAKAQFPHASSARLRENGYTIVESTTHSLGVDVVLDNHDSVGTLFVSNSNGTYFIESLPGTNRNDAGYVDFENIYGVDGIGIANIVSNAQEFKNRGVPKQLQSRITFDDGRTWTQLEAPEKDVDGKSIGCDTNDREKCSLHLHSITTPHNFGRIFSSPAPGFVMGVGSVGSYLKPYEDCDTFLSTDAGLTWKMIHKDAHIYEFGDSGSIMVIANDEDGIESVRYSTDEGKSWKEKSLGLTIRSRALVTVPDSTSQKFVMVGQLARKDKTSEGGIAVVHLDFAPTRSRQCTEDDMEKWYARSSKGKECLMGHKQWYWRRKADADCYVGKKFDDPVEHEENCPCEDQDYECDYNFVRTSEGKCEPRGPEPVPEGVCTKGDPNETFKGSSGYRLIPGNTCDRDKGVKKDKPVEKKCSQAAPPNGKVAHQIFKFPAKVLQQEYFRDSTTILVRLEDHTIWQSNNEGYTWHQLHRGEKFLVFYLHPYSSDRGYLITDSSKYFYTTDTGKNWFSLHAKLPTNTFGIPVLYFNPQNSDNLIWHGSSGCEAGYGGDCHVEAHYSTNHGRDWSLVDKYVRTCEWARDKDLHADPTQIMCESYRTKKGAQRSFNKANNPLEFITGTNYYQKKKKLFNSIVGFAKFSEYLVVAEVMSNRDSLDLQVSLDGQHFAVGQFPPTMRPDQHSYTILESSTDSLFLHVTTNEQPGMWWGNILKSNSNGTYFGISVEHVNRNEAGYVDFEKVIGIDGIALINVVSNAEEAGMSGKKKLQSRITHNDGGTWKRLTPPKKDSQGREYECKTVACSLQVHGYTERYDPRATYSTPSVPGLLMAVGNVGETLAPYTESDTFLSRDGGFTWEEVHKDAHLWEFGDSGSVLVMTNDEVPTNTVLFTTDEGLHWQEYQFADEKYRVRQILTVPSDTSRRFILFADAPGGRGSVAIQIDFSSLTTQKCQINLEDPGHDDFELWSPSEERAEQCLFGRQVLYHRRKRDRNCVVGNQEKAKERVVKDCECVESDFECEYNYVRVNGECKLSEGLKPLPSTDEVCREGEEKWYDRTAYRKIAHSSCKGGKRLDRGAEHVCPGLGSRSGWFWLFMALIPAGFAGMVGSWWYKTHGPGAGAIRLPGGDGTRTHYYGGSASGGWVDTLASVPWFVVGVAGVAVEWVGSKFRGVTTDYRASRGYRHVPVDEDARVLRFEDEE